MIKIEISFVFPLFYNTTDYTFMNYHNLFL